MTVSRNFTLSHNFLWVLVALFAVGTVAGVFSSNLMLTVLNLAIMVAFVLLPSHPGAGPHRWRRGTGSVSM